MMLFKRIPKKMIFIFIGDIFLIKIAQRLNYYMLQRYFYNNIPDLSTRIFTVLIFVFTYYIFDLYDPERNFNSIRYFTKFLCALIVASIVQSVGFYLFFFTQYSRSIFLLNIIGIGFWTYSWRLFLNRFYKRLMPVRKIVIVGAGRAAKTIYNILKGNTNYKIIGFLDDDDEKIGTKIDSVPVIGNMHLIPEIIERQEANIIVLAITYQKKPELFRYMLEGKIKGIEIYDMPAFYERLHGEIPVEHIKDSWFVYNEISGVKIGIYNRHMKRIFDLIISISALIISLPISIIAIICIKLESKGPIFYRQIRVGLDNSIFNVIKFRSMKQDAEANGAVWAKKNDDRVTRAGKILRKLRIDEIPQFWNVFKGEMSFIGPRPERPEFVKQLSEKIPYYELRHCVRPGITGWAQVNYPYGDSVKDAMRKLQYDLYYIKYLSVFMDLHVFIKTVKVVLWSRGSR